jgi:hypothetical protein
MSEPSDSAFARPDGVSDGFEARPELPPKPAEQAPVDPADGRLERRL